MGVYPDNDPRIASQRGTLGSPTRKRRIQIIAYVEILNQLLCGFTAEKTVRILATCGTFGSHTRRKYDKLLYMLNFLDHLLGYLREKRPSEFQFRLALSGRLIRRKEAKLAYMLNFRPFTRWLYRGNDHPGFSHTWHFFGSPTRRVRIQINAYVGIF